MSKRRHSGEWVWLKPNSGFVSESNKLKVQILPERMVGRRLVRNYCMLNCGDPNCIEWNTLRTEKINGKYYFLYHVSECQMLDEPWKDEDENENNNS